MTISNLFVIIFLINVYGISIIFGNLKINGRIIGGNLAGENEFPYVVGIKQYNVGHICGGAIIHEKYILTAAHCVTDTFLGLMYEIKPEKLFVIAGTIKLSDGNQLKVKRIKYHENYTYDDDLQNDIALLELENPLIFNDSIRPIELYTGNDIDRISNGSKVVISGWGQTKNNQTDSNELLKYNILSVLPQHECLEFLRNKTNENPSKSNTDTHTDTDENNDTDNIILDTDNTGLANNHNVKNTVSNVSSNDEKFSGILCLRHLNNEGPCSGDSGGPAVYNGKLLGIIDFSVGDCAGNNPDGYTSVPYFLNWILVNMK